MATRTERILIEGMSCRNCERHIREALKALPGVVRVQVSYTDAAAVVEYDPDILPPGELAAAVEAAGYGIRHGDPARAGGGTRIAGAALLILCAYLLLRHTGLLQLANVFPTAEAGAGFGMLFLIGLLTSVHCVAMCGGINLTQCIPVGMRSGDTPSTLRPGLLYNLGRVISYTVVGGLAGAVGSVISFSGAARGVVQLAAGLFMVLMGLNMLGIFPGLRRLVPHLPASLGDRLRSGGQGNGPLVVGLLNGFMPCGPLQAMQLYALSTGSAAEGALSMLLFSLGTVPLMLGLSIFSSLMSRRFTKRVMTVGAVLVVVLGLSMLQSGLALSGFAAAPAQTGAQSAARVADGVQYVTTSLDSGRYQSISVEAGIPVVWTIDAAPGTINGCNNRIIIPEYGVEKRLEEGANTIEFLPQEGGVFSYSCWMGMIRSTITVSEDGVVPEPPVTSSLPPVEFSGPTCC